MLYTLPVNYFVVKLFVFQSRVKFFVCPATFYRGVVLRELYNFKGPSVATLAKRRPFSGFSLSTVVLKLNKLRVGGIGS
jgi:hypothetical protein